MWWWNWSLNIAIFIYLPPFIDKAKHEEYIPLGMYGEIHSVAELSYSFPWEFLYRTFIFLRCHRLNSLRPFVKLDGIGSLWKDVILNRCSRECDQKVLIDEKLLWNIQYMMKRLYSSVTTGSCFSFKIGTLLIQSCLNNENKVHQQVFETLYRNY